MEAYLKHVIDITKATSAVELEVIQTLWSGYGKIARVSINDSSLEHKTVIVKHISPPKELSHPRGWNTNTSHQRKIKSYQVESNWYLNWSKKFDSSCKIPSCLGQYTHEEEQIIVLEDLDQAGYDLRKTVVTLPEVKSCLQWLANFHAINLNANPQDLWEIGTYWHLETRPDEYKAMEEGPLKEVAHQLDQILNSCSFQTIVHGDAKLANFCFSNDTQTVAAVDFQYVGGGCGMKDVAYFLGSCLSSEECQEYEKELLDYYFVELKNAIPKDKRSFNLNELEEQWRRLYPIAWADFSRFLVGWAPDHSKLNAYSGEMINKALSFL